MLTRDELAEIAKLPVGERKAVMVAVEAAKKAARQAEKRAAAKAAKARAATVGDRATTAAAKYAAIPTEQLREARWTKTSNGGWGVRLASGDDADAYEELRAVRASGEVSRVRVTGVDVRSLGRGAAISLVEQC